MGQTVGSCAPLGGEKNSRMGNGASSSAQHITIDGETYDVGKVKMLIPELRKQVQDKNGRIQQLSSELQEKNRQLKERDEEVRRLLAEVDKLKSVLQLKVTDTTMPSGKPDILATIGEESLTVQAEFRSKRQGVSGESPSANQGAIELKHVEKDFRYVFSPFLSVSLCLCFCLTVFSSFFSVSLCLCFSLSLFLSDCLFSLFLCLSVFVCVCLCSCLSV